MQPSTRKALVWFGNNLRVNDNSVLRRAVLENDEVLAVYCIEPAWFARHELGFKKMDRFRAEFLLESLIALRESLAAIGIPFQVYFAAASEKVPLMVREHGVDALYFQQEWTRDECRLIDRVLLDLPSETQVCRLYDQFLYHPEDIPFTHAEIPEVFTVFRKKCEALAQIRTAEPIPRPKRSTLLDLLPVPSIADLGFSDFEKDSRTAFPFKGGEAEAMNRLESYFFETKKLGVYKKTRNGLLGTDYSSKFSPWLANGSLSARTIFWKVKEFEAQFYKNQSTYWLVFELIWRDFFKYISLKHGDAIFHLEGIRRRSYSWERDRELFSSWAEGCTPDSFVNANMLELKHSGWMSNRGRQNVASYFARDLQLDWRWGASYFESLLLDYDVHSNYGNWMYVSGVGNDPRDRKFNTQLQAQRYDPTGRFQRTWLQESLFS